MVWASRRAVLPNPDDWARLLEEDGFRRISDSEVTVGDIIVYRSAMDGEILHVGRVCALDAILLDGTASPRQSRVMLVLSKLDATMGEVIHRKDDITISGSQEFVSQAYTDR
jgi:hypothetical protein